MASHLSFLAVLASMLAAAAYSAFILKNDGPIHGVAEEKAFESFLNTFRSRHRPVMDINFMALYGAHRQFQVLRPSFSITGLVPVEQFQRCDREDSMVDLGDQKSARTAICGDDTLGAFDVEAEAKGRKLKTYLDEAREIPEDLVLSHPFIDPSGFSYAYLIAENIAAHGPPSTKQMAWIKQHLSFFKVSELKDVIAKVKIEDPRFLAISDFNDGEIGRMIRGDTVVLTKNYILFKNQSLLGFTPLSYWLYDTRDLRADLQDGSFDVVTSSPETICIQRIDNLCWVYNAKTAAAYLYGYADEFVFFMGLSSLAVFGLYLRYIFERIKVQKQHQLSLQVLSHEFRTPVASLLLLMDQLSKNQTRFVDKDQDLLTRAAGDVFRLQRVIEMSRSYLQASNHRTRFQFVKIRSINSWLNDFVAEVDSRIVFEPLIIDQTVRADVFWLRFVLNNLIQYAFVHGREPVYVRLSELGGQVRLAVEDRGTCAFGSLSEMTEAFVKGPTSQGMGLGLNMSKMIVKEWGSRIEFSKNPTSFSFGFECRGFSRWLTF